MPLIPTIIILVIVGFVLWLINTYVPMARPIKTILNLVVIVVVVLWLLAGFGLINGDMFGGLRLK